MCDSLPNTEFGKQGEANSFSPISYPTGKGIISAAKSPQTEFTRAEGIPSRTEFSSIAIIAIYAFEPGHFFTYRFN